MREWSRGALQRWSQERWTFRTCWHCNPIPGPIKSILQGAHPDCFFSIAVNSNATPTPPVLDNLRFK
jgi:hypothetical protein